MLSMSHATQNATLAAWINGDTFFAEVEELSTSEDLVEVASTVKSVDQETQPPAPVVLCSSEATQSAQPAFQRNRSRKRKVPKSVGNFPVSRIIGEGQDVGRAKQGRARAEELTWEQLGQLGLHRALHEYYQMTAETSRERLKEATFAKANKSALFVTLVRVVLPTLPKFLELRNLATCALQLWRWFQFLCLASAPYSIPVLIWNCAGAKMLRVTTLFGVLSISPSGGVWSWGVLLGAIMCLFAFERATLVAKEREVAREAECLTAQSAPRRLPPQHISLAGSQTAAARGSMEGSAAIVNDTGIKTDVLQTITDKMNCVRLQVYGQGAGPALECLTLAEAVWEVQQLCLAVGCEFDGSKEEMHHPERILAKLQQLKLLIG